MKIAFIFSRLNFSGRPDLDFEHIWSHHRGLTGSELAAIEPARELAKRGHEVHLFTPAPPCTWEGVRIRPEAEASQIDDSFDAAIAINTPDDLRVTRAKVRACWHLLADLRYVRPGLNEHLDLFIACSEGHRAMVSGVNETYAGHRFTLDPTKIVTVGLGCRPERYQVDAKRPGFCAYTSSPDRGLHWLLQEWPRIRREAPHATLQVFYRFAPWAELVGNQDGEQGRRARYIREALTRLRPHGVTLRDAVSQDHLALQLSRAECLPYPCDPMQPTETFGCAVLEAMAARACPVITNADAFGELYGGHVEMVDRDQPGWVAEWRERVVRVLKDEQFRADCNDRAQAFAAKRTWAESARELEAAVTARLARLEAA